MHATDDAGVPERLPQERFWGHPRQLWMLLGVTVGLNFAFYGFRAFLTPYIADTFFAHLGASAAQKQADLLASGFLALMYATPIIGGYVADKVLGETRALAMSLWLGTISLLLMASPSLSGFEIGLSLFALAAGLGIPLTVLIGRNYAKDDSRREGGYTLYYLAINLGSFVTPFICADLIGQRYGFRWGFVAAAAGMLLAAAVFQWRKHKLAPILPDGSHLHGRMATVWVLLATLALTYPVALLLAYPTVLRTAMYVLMALLVIYFVVRCIQRGDRVQTQRYLALLLLFVAMVVFWALSLQGVTSLNFFARDHVVAPFHYTLFQSANPLYILLFAPFMAMLWPWLQRRGRDPSTPRKFGIGVLFVALSYGLLAWAISHAAGDRVGWMPLALCYLLQTLGELALSPIGYALVGQLAAPEEASLAMGGWFFGTALAYQLAGWIATQTASSGNALQGFADYGHVYARLFWGGLVVAVVFLLAAPGIRRLMHGVR
ncbi:oligopeptide:H+ symporter [Oleiagrimonas citrea]|uniref:Peptide MFS transporter n=1 Tax=Oleiagrimonas citrea TaxID=1665687 RepID=A0A846ZLC3_9GAMM|nr:peptide MFS transporter [Oleiagrimonas citrea]NKZ38330.1 peptide MFS transporter [Oleiagrimonas citrea]